MGDFRIRFWGVRGSIPSPGPDTVRYGGNTACIEMRLGPHLLIVDAGSGIRPLGRSLLGAGPVQADILFTHTHYDHVSGLPFFAPAYDPANRFTLWEGHLGPDQTLKAVLRQLMSAPLFPVPVNLIDRSCAYRKFAPGDMLTPRPGITVRTAALNHPNGCVGYRIEHAGRAVCTLFDTEHTPGTLDPAALDLARGADVLIYDANYTDAELPDHTGWGHSTWEQGCRLAKAAGVGQLLLFHHDPARDDAALDAIGRAAAAQFAETRVAAEGLLITL